MFKTGNEVQETNNAWAWLWSISDNISNSLFWSTFPISTSDSISKYVFETISKLFPLKKFTTSSFKDLIYGVTTDILLIFFFLSALIAAVLGAVTNAFGLATLIFFLMLSKPEVMGELKDLLKNSYKLF